MHVFLYPRFSYRCPKLTVSAAAWTSDGLFTVRGMAGTGYGTGIAGWNTGWVIRGTTGHPPTTCLRAPPPTSDRRERALPQAGWVGCRWGARWVFGCGDGPYPPCGPGRSLQALPGRDLAGCSLWANKGEIRVPILET